MIIFAGCILKHFLMMRRLLSLLFTVVLTITLPTALLAETAQRTKYKDGPAFIYRIYLIDKQHSPYSIEHPHRYLSRRSIERRKRQNLPIDSTDLPVNPRYVRLLKSEQVQVVGKSRWHNTLLIRVKDSTLMQRIRQLPCVKGSHLVWQSPDSVVPSARHVKYHEQFEARDSAGMGYYGKAKEQIFSLHGEQLHEKGFLGNGMMIAVIDGGFKNVDRIPAFRHIDIRGSHDFVYPHSASIFAETDHGTKVLSAMAIHEPQFYVGTAPKASYWLLRSEDQQTEQEVEEDYWTMAAEFADSVGCDIINSSLGYNEYDYPTMSHRLWHLDGRTAFASRSASLLAGKGMLLVNSAGNSGMGPWKKIGIPSDAEHILTVGAVTPEAQHAEGHIAPFSSIGPTQDGRIKPDIVAIGAPAFLVNGRGVIMEDMGTSFATPIVCGLMACLWQAFPEKTAMELMEIIRRTGNNRQHPDNVYGYGVPDFRTAYENAKSHE